MDVLYFPPIWPEEQRFSPPTSLESTGSPNLPDDVINILAAKSKLKQKLKKVSNTIKRYTLPPRAAYPQWTAYTCRHVRPELVESDESGESLTTSTLDFANTDRLEHNRIFHQPGMPT